MPPAHSVVVYESSTTGWLSVVSPYNAEFVARAKALGGQWHGGAWNFGPDKAVQLGELLDEVFPGWDSKDCTRPGRAAGSPTRGDGRNGGTASGSRPKPADRGTSRG